MDNREKLKIKICCIGSLKEAELAINYGATAIGLVGPMPSGPGIINNNLIESIAKNIPTDISSFLLTSETKAKNIIAHYNEVRTTTIQLVDRINHEDYDIIKSALPSVELIQVIHVQDESSIKEAIHIADYADGLLLDSGRPNESVKILGGTGKTHNWEISRRIKEAISIPLYLAGGINSKNVKAAIEMVKPDGVDLCSGVRTNDQLDELKLSDFFKAINVPT